jgi:hypothetical protein
VRDRGKEGLAQPRLQLPLRIRGKKTASKFQTDRRFKLSHKSLPTSNPSHGEGLPLQEIPNLSRDFREMGRSGRSSPISTRLKPRG